jgi:hypothetical protein
MKNLIFAFIAIGMMAFKPATIKVIAMSGEKKSITLTYTATGDYVDIYLNGTLIKEHNTGNTFTYPVKNWSKSMTFRFVEYTGTSQSGVDEVYIGGKNKNE